MPNRVIDVKSEVSRLRSKVITSFYNELLGRNPDEKELKYYVDRGDPLEIIYVEIKISKKARDGAEEGGKLPLTILILAKDEEEAIGGCIKSVQEYARDIMVIDTGSTDGTKEIAKDFGARIYDLRFSSFSELLTIGVHAAFQPTVMWIDCDERLIRQEKLAKYVLDIVEGQYSAVAFPRSRWADWEMTKQVEKYQYPDWQVRLIKRDINLIYRRANPHNEFHGAAVKHFPVEELPEVAHFCDLFPEKRKARRIQNLKIAMSKGFKYFLSECCKQEDIYCDRHEYLESIGCERCSFYTRIYHDFMNYTGEIELSWDNVQSIFVGLGVPGDVWSRWEEKYKEVL